MRSHDCRGKIKMEREFTYNDLVQERTYDKWQDFIAYMSSIKQQPNLLWRGQAKASWSVVSSYSRHIIKKTANLKGKMCFPFPHPIEDVYNDLIQNMPNHIGGYSKNEFWSIYKTRNAENYDPKYFIEQFLNSCENGTSKNSFSFGAPSDFTFNTCLNLQNWAWGQHYGVKTPLVDWTLKPFFALYFALSTKRAVDTSPVAVFSLNVNSVSRLNASSLSVAAWERKSVFDKKGFIKSLKNFFRNTPLGDWIDSFHLDDQNFDACKNWDTVAALTDAMKLKLIYPKYIADRIDRLKAQDGWFSFCPGGMGIERWCGRFVSLKRTTCEKSFNLLTKHIISLSPSSRKECLAFLDAANINAKTMFPDFNGISGYMKELDERRQF